MNPEKAPRRAKADFEPTDCAKDNEFPKVRERNPECGYHRACGSAPHCQQPWLRAEWPSSQEALSMCLHGALSLLKYVRKAMLVQTLCSRRAARLEELSWARISARVLCGGGQNSAPLLWWLLVSATAQHQGGCAEPWPDAGRAPGDRESSVLLLAVLRQEQNLASCLMKETPSFYICFF